MRQVHPESADSFARTWSEFGYNSLGEEGVVRCDLLREVERPNVFLSRKVFRSRDALHKHEASAHYVQWRQQVREMMLSESFEQQLLDSAYPAAAPFPFRSQW